MERFSTVAGSLSTVVWPKSTGALRSPVFRPHTLNKSPTSFLRSLRSATQRAPEAAAAVVPLKVEAVFLPASPYHPAVSLFANHKQAQATAENLGAPWAPITFACGYLIADGWRFHDTQGVLATFCPVPHECLEVIQDIVAQLQTSELEPKYYPIHIAQALRDSPVLASLTPAFFDSVGLCTLMRIAHPAYSGKRDDWLTVPAWALRIPKRRARLK